MNDFNLMSVNLLLIAFAVLMICNSMSGYKKGMVKAVISFVSVIITSIVVVLLGNALKSYNDGEIFNVIVMVLLLCVVGIVRHLLGVIFFSAKVISKLPIVSWVNQLLGIVFGILETILILWTIYTFVMMLDLGVFGQIILDYTEGSRILSWLYENNYLAHWVEQLGAQISF